MKGQHWFMEADMKQTQTLRPDKTGRALLTVLRHLGRLHEVRPPSVACSYVLLNLDRGKHPGERTTRLASAVQLACKDTVGAEMQTGGTVACNSVLQS